MSKASENTRFIEQLSEAADVKPAKTKRLIEALEKYEVDLSRFSEACTYTFAHTREWCGYPLCRES